MGTDIHLVVQQRTATGEWSDVPLPWSGYSAPLTARNYDVFAILGNVRNGFGFAGVPTGEGFPPVSDGRGLPEDFVLGSYTDEYGDTHTDCRGTTWMGDHSWSWVTLAELEAYPWRQTSRHTGVVPESVYLAWSGAGPPAAWCGGVTGPNVLLFETDAEYRAWNDSGRPGESPRQKGRFGESVYIRASWEESYADAAGAFFTEGLPWLRTLGGPEDVRLVFGFDS